MVIWRIHLLSVRKIKDSITLSRDDLCISMDKKSSIRRYRALEVACIVLKQACKGFSLPIVDTI